MKNDLKIFLAAPRGFCAGVDRAIEIVKKTLKKYGSPVYVRHEIVHNKNVVGSLKKLGAIFVEEISEISDPSRPVIFSAHGVPKNVPEEAKLKKIFYIDATCPLVSKVHRETEQLHKKGFDIVLIGHRNHPEVIGTMGQLPNGSIKLIETVDEVNNLNFTKPLAYVTQTTLSVDDTKEMIDALKLKFPNIKGPIKEDICYATQNRQDAVKVLAEKCQLIIVIGSSNSSNSNRLVETSKQMGAESFIVDLPEEIDFSILDDYDVVGVTSGASVPSYLIDRLVQAITKRYPSVSVFKEDTIEKDILFPLPKEVADMRQ